MSKRENMYQEMRYGKKALIVVGIIVTILSLGAFVGGIFLIVRGSMNPGGAWEIIWRVVFGAIVVIFGAIFFCIGVAMLAITKSMINTTGGSVADGNRAIGTVNVTKCPKCGTKLEKGAKFCKKCGEKQEVGKCPNCGLPLSKDSKFCENCGKEIEISE